MRPSHTISGRPPLTRRSQPSQPHPDRQTPHVMLNSFQHLTVDSNLRKTDDSYLRKTDGSYLRIPQTTPTLEPIDHLVIVIVNGHSFPFSTFNFPLSDPVCHAFQPHLLTSLHSISLCQQCEKFEWRCPRSCGNAVRPFRPAAKVTAASPHLLHCRCNKLPLRNNTLPRQHHSNFPLLSYRFPLPELPPPSAHNTTSQTEKRDSRH